MEQDQLQTYEQGEGFKPNAVANVIPALDRINARLNSADQEALAQVRRNNQTRVENSKSAGQDLIALSKMSKTLTDALIERQEGINEDERLEGSLAGQEAAMAGTLDLTKYNEGMAKAKQVDNVVQDIGAELLSKDPNNYEAVSQLTGKTTWRSKGFREGYYGTIMTRYNSEVDSMVVPTDYPDSASFSQARAVARKAFFKKHGLHNASTELLAKTVYPKIAQAEAKALSNWKTTFAINDSEKSRVEYAATLGQNKDVHSYLNAVRNTVDRNGNPLGFAGAWKQFDSEMVELRKAGMVSDADIENMKSQPIPGDAKGRTYGQLHAAKFENIQRQVAAQARTDWNNSEADRRMEFQQAEQELVASFLDASDTDGYTDDQIDDAIDTLRKTYGMNSTELTTLKANTVDAATRKVQEEQIESLQEMGLLTPERLKKFDPKLQRKYMSVAQQQGKMRKESGGYKAQMAAIKDAVESRVKLNKSMANHPAIGLMVAEMQRKYQAAVTKLAVGGDENAANSALSEIIGDFDAAFPVGMGTTDAIKKYSQMTLGQFGSNNTQAIAQFEQVKNVLKENPNAYEEFPFVAEADLQKIIKGYGKPGFDPGATINYIADRLNVDPLAVLNKQLELNGMDVLPPTPAMEIVNQLTPKQQQLLQKYKSPERSARGFGGTGKFKPEIIPHGLGETVQASAKKHNIPPAILAGLLETESSWKKGQVSSAGAIGMAQIMPATAQELGVDPRIPEQAIEGAAKYLRHIMDTKGVDINTALYMYNAGPNRGSYPYGQENKDYLQKVLKFSYKYGNGSQTLSDPRSFRSSVLAYVSGNIGPTSTGPHLDVKEVGGGNFSEDALDEFVEVDDPEFGRVSLGEIRSRTGGVGDNQAQHRARGSHGVDYGLHSGTKVYVKNGAEVIGSQPSEHGDIVTIKLPNGKQYTFLHGNKA